MHRQEQQHAIQGLTLRFKLCLSFFKLYFNTLEWGGWGVGAAQYIMTQGPDLSGCRAKELHPVKCKWGVKVPPYSVRDNWKRERLFPVPRISRL